MFLRGHLWPLSFSPNMTCWFSSEICPKHTFFSNHHLSLAPLSVVIPSITCRKLQNLHLHPRYCSWIPGHPSSHLPNNFTWICHESQRPLNGSKFSSVAQLCPTLCDPKDCSTPGFPIYHQLPELAQTHVHWVSDAIQPSHPLASPSPPVFNLFQHQGLFQWVSSSHQVAKVLELQLQHQSFQWIFRTDLL